MFYTIVRYRLDFNMAHQFLGITIFVMHNPELYFNINAPLESPILGVNFMLYTYLEQCRKPWELLYCHCIVIDPLPNPALFEGQKGNECTLLQSVKDPVCRTWRRIWAGAHRSRDPLGGWAVSPHPSNTEKENRKTYNCLALKATEIVPKTPGLDKESNITLYSIRFTKPESWHLKQKKTITSSQLSVEHFFVLQRSK